MEEKDGKYYCIKCKTLIPADSIEKHGHDDGDGYVDVELRATCPNCGRECDDWE